MITPRGVDEIFGDLAEECRHQEDAEGEAEALQQLLQLFERLLAEILDLEDLARQDPPIRGDDDDVERVLAAGEVLGDVLGLGLPPAAGLWPFLAAVAAADPSLPLAAPYAGPEEILAGLRRRLADAAAPARKLATS